MTALQELIRAFKRDKMQEFYTKEQMIYLLEFKLEREQEQIIDAYLAGVDVDSFCIKNPYTEAEQYYKEQYLKK
jgi:hypothetical protein